jgi:phosphohistidine phosphatase
MELYILRHGIAETSPESPAAGDGERRLTEEGIDKMRRAARGMKALELAFDIILTSPLRRARETAEIVAHEYEVPKKLQVTPGLAPDGNPKELIDDLRKHLRGGKKALLVGHEPYLSRLISLLISGDTRTSIDLKKGALCKLTAGSLDYGRCAALEWLMTSRQLRRHG